MTGLVVLGAGPAGLGAALGAAERGHEVLVLEREDQVGGHTASFTLDGVRVDLGSHRLHPAAAPRVLERLRGLLGDELLERPRRGRILLAGRWIRFPLRPLDLLLRLPPAFALGVLRDQVAGLVRARRPAGESFAEAVEAGLGRTVGRGFYFPFARKIWGLEPEELSAEQARRRISAGSPAKLAARLLPRAGPAARRKRVFLYPRGGFGRICERLADAARAAGARIVLGAEVEELALSPAGGAEVRVRARGGAQRHVAASLWSTIPLSTLAALARPEPPAEVRAAREALRTRAMCLVYLVLATDRFSPYDAHYFPGEELPFTRVSEPKNYAGADEPRGRTVLCAEFPCDAGDATWRASDEELGTAVRDGLARAGLPLGAPLERVATRRLASAYPVYARGFERSFALLDGWASALPGVLSFGRQGLFAHDNTHHALAMADAAVDCLRSDGSFDRERWRLARRAFEEHVVED